MAARRWLFGDQLGPHFLDSEDQQVLMVEARGVFRRRRFHRQKAHLVLSAMRHRALELGDRVRYVAADGYRSSLADGPLSVCRPTSWAAYRFVSSLPEVEVLPARGFATEVDDFAAWARSRGRRRLLMEDHYRRARARLGVLMEGEDPVGGRWNLDHDNRQPPPRGVRRLPVPEPWWPQEDEVDEQVRADLDRWEADGDVSFVGRDGPRLFPATRAEALHRLEDFVEHRLPLFGPYEDAMLAGDDWMAHSMVSAPMNLGLLDPVEVVERVERAFRDGTVPLQSAEGFVRQVIGWRDYVWNVYWLGGEDYRHRNALQAREPLPRWFQELDADAVEARCLSDVLRSVRDHGWAHHIPRLMVLGNYGLQRGWDPLALTDWFHRSFVDGYDWVMVPNVVGMSQHADGGAMATKPYAAGGAYINRMSDYCGGCAYRPSVRRGDDACPYTAGYWWFLHRNRERLAGNPRMRQPLNGMDRLADLEDVVAQERERGSDAP
ncbi:cryptochrome/photolyase family protein [Vallicoccus soli]|uniref:Cryptochrome/photolyase family protein n=1 Tax=Vallicoccus soli TaxID=2339232 RepID=A0A3A3ZMH7_9ACTN|nr:cryptochrome/photolyase family protein [Vallicoccus soli]RJK97831.1 cryptochrome/photolyase family protein [Vallicoccus soli]